MHLFYLREALRSIRQHGGLAMTAVLSITGALLLAGAFLLLTHNAEGAMRLIGDRREMVIYLRDGVTPSQRDLLTGRLHDLYGEVVYVSKQQAWDEFSQSVGDPELLEAVGENPLPASLRVKLRAELLNAASMEAVSRQVTEFPEVEDVRYGAEWVRRLEELSGAFRFGAIAAGVVVALAIVFLLYNTMRLMVQARRHQVEIMSRLGASDRFISTPFVIEASVVAAAAALIALGLLFAAQQALAGRLLGVTFMPWSWALAFLGATIALAWIAAQLALARVLRAVGP
ncbi:MAG: permease-like cell division protein FtsX [Candidatus Eisenbacteria bacterium]